VKITKILLNSIMIFMIGSCSALKPAVEDPVKKDESVKRAVISKVSPAQSDGKIIVNQEKRITPADKISYSVSDLNISEKNNGVLISLDYKGDDPRSNITTFFSGDNFFNISFYKGSFSDKVKNYVYNKAIVGTVKFFEFKDSVQITVRLKKDYNSSHVITEKNRIIISVFN